MRRRPSAGVLAGSTTCRPRGRPDNESQAEHVDDDCPDIVQCAVEIKSPARVHTGQEVVPAKPPLLGVEQPGPHIVCKARERQERGAPNRDLAVPYSADPPSAPANPCSLAEIPCSRTQGKRRLGPRERAGWETLASPEAGIRAISLYFPCRSGISARRRVRDRLITVRITTTPCPFQVFVALVGVGA